MDTLSQPSALSSSATPTRSDKEILAFRGEKVAAKVLIDRGKYKQHQASS